MVTGADLDGSGEGRVEVWPEGLLILPSVGALFGVRGALTWVLLRPPVW